MAKSNKSKSSKTDALNEIVEVEDITGLPEEEEVVEEPAAGDEDGEEEVISSFWFNSLCCPLRS